MGVFWIWSKRFLISAVTASVLLISAKSVLGAVHNEVSHNPPTYPQAALRAFDGGVEHVIQAAPGMDIRYGRGFDSVTGTIKDQCVAYNGNQGEVGTVEGSGSSGGLHYTYVSNAEDLRSELRIDASASFSFGLYSADGAVQKYRQEHISSYSAVLGLSEDDSESTKYLISAEPTKIAKKYAHDPYHFRNSCGDQYIVAETFGGDLTALFVENTNSQRTQDSLDADFQGSSGFGSLSVAAKTDVTDQINSHHLKIDIWRDGGYGNYPSQWTLDNFYAWVSGWEKDVAQHPKLISITTKPYGSIGPSTDTQAARILGLLADHQAELYRREQGLQYISDHMDLFGGVDANRLASDLADAKSAITQTDQLAINCADAVKAGKNCTEPSLKTVPTLPKRIKWQCLDPTINVPTVIARTPFGETQWFEAAGRWSAWLDPDNQWFSSATFGYQDQFGAGSPVRIDGGVVTKIPPHSSITYNIDDNIPGDNVVKRDDPLRFALYTPVYSDVAALHGRILKHRNIKANGKMQASDESDLTNCPHSYPPSKSKSSH